MIVRMGIAHVIISTWPEYSKSGRWMALVFDARNHQAKASVARIVGTTIASMMATESMRMVASPLPTCPCGSSTFGWQPANVSVASKPQRRSARVIGNRAFERGGRSSERIANFSCVKLPRGCAAASVGFPILCGRGVWNAGVAEERIHHRGRRQAKAHRRSHRHGERVE